MVCSWGLLGPHALLFLRYYEYDRPHLSHTHISRLRKFVRCIFHTAVSCLSQRAMYAYFFSVSLSFSSFAGSYIPDRAQRFVHAIQYIDHSQS